MTLRTFLFILFLATVLAWLAWGLVLFNFAPPPGDLLALLFFYASLTLALAGTFTLLGFTLRRWQKPVVLPYRQVLIAWRQALWFTLLLLGLLILQSQQLLTWWNALLLLVALTVLEFFFLSFPLILRGEILLPKAAEKSTIY